jgi:hypothetical protein
MQNISRDRTPVLNDFRAIQISTRTSLMPPMIKIRSLGIGDHPKLLSARRHARPSPVMPNTLPNKVGGK